MGRGGGGGGWTSVFSENTITNKKFKLEDCLHETSKPYFCQAFLNSV